MAKTTTESVPDMADGAVIAGTEVRTRVEDDQTILGDVEAGTATVADPENIKLNKNRRLTTAA